MASLLLIAMMRRWMPAAVLGYAVLLGESVAWPLATGPACLVLLIVTTVRKSALPVATFSAVPATS